MPGGSRIPYTPSCSLFYPSSIPRIPVYRTVDGAGKLWLHAFDGHVKLLTCPSMPVMTLIKLSDMLTHARVGEINEEGCANHASQHVFMHGYVVQQECCFDAQHTTELRCRFLLWPISLHAVPMLACTAGKDVPGAQLPHDLSQDTCVAMYKVCCHHGTWHATHCNRPIIWHDHYQMA